MRMNGRNPSSASEFAADLEVVDRDALDDLYSLAYSELKRVAKSIRRRDRQQSLTTTALVHDAWLKLVRSSDLKVANDKHFKRIVARAMRQLLVESARRHRAAKRGSGADLVITLPEELIPDLAPHDYVLALNEALSRLAERYPRQARSIEMHYFGGYDIAETAALLEISRATVERDCRFAKAWLRAELRGDG